MWKIYKNDCSDLSFTKICLFYQEITLEEFKPWIEKLISELDMDDIPLYFFDLLDFNDGIGKIGKIIGYQPHGNLTQEEKNAISGIAVLRGEFYSDDSDISKENALQALIDNPQILEKYKKFFPFIDLPDPNTLNSLAKE